MLKVDCFPSALHFLNVNVMMFSFVYSQSLRIRLWEQEKSKGFQLNVEVPQKVVIYIVKKGHFMTFYLFKGHFIMFYLP